MESALSFGAGWSEREPFPAEQALLAAGCTRAHLFIFLIPRQTFFEGQACFFHPNTFPQTLLSTQEGHVFNQSLKWNLPRAPGVPLGQCPPLSGGQHPGVGGGSALIPGHLLSWEAPCQPGMWR